MRCFYSSFWFPILTMFFLCSHSGAESLFNQEDKDVESNGNVQVAVEKVKNISSEEMDRLSVPMPVADVTKKIYSTLGRPLKIRGEVYQVEEMRKHPNRLGTWTQVLMLTKNPNASMGLMTVEFLYYGDSQSINPMDIITCSGYLAGLYYSDNVYGGSVEGLMLVGNHFKKEKTRKDRRR